MRLGARTWREVHEGSPSVLAVPLGSCEQHGPHLPLDTDTRIAVALADGLAAARPDVLVAPAVAYGASGEHVGFDGTISIGQDGVTLLVLELVRSADAFAGVILVNGHGGNVEAMDRAIAILDAEGRPVLAWTPTGPGDAHAGRTETSTLLALAPSIVRLERAEAGATAPLAELMPVLRGSGVASVAPNGVLGDPAGASASEGRALVTTMTAALIEAVDEWRRRW